MTAPPDAQAGEGWYVYGVVAADDAAAAAGAAGPLVEAAGLAAVTARVPLDEFGEEALERNVRDPGWLEAKVRVHEDVLERVAAGCAVVPFGFGTIYLGREHVTSLLEEHADELARALERVRGRVELGVKAFLDPARVEAGEPAPALPSTGRAYLLERRREQRLAETARATAAACAGASHERLAAAAEAAVATPVQRPEVARGPGEMILNGAYLVRADAVDRFEAEVAALEDDYAGRGVVYALTGPWPPYNFVRDVEAR